MNIKRGTVKRPLQAPYDGPYCVLRRTDKMFTIEKNGKESTINIDRVKSAFFENSHQSSAPTIASPPVTVPSSMQSVQCRTFFITSGVTSKFLSTSNISQMDA
ncbi:hypothetical protein AVEN_55276-1 [Araneus ventricosus]|uniref:Uncharacterized protein n=1 Tax=Araneus ventricosus TaxID=182803 RepID=A0A4Y2D969_ARAVE|nr:hypothetical protein AVEN_55276-1 [Araneus ventricosus]